MQASDLPVPEVIPEVVKKEEWDGWLEHPVTKVFRTLLLMRREEIKEQLALGVFTDGEAVGNALLYGKAIGGAKALADLLELDPATVNQELNHE